MAISNEKTKRLKRNRSIFFIVTFAAILFTHDAFAGGNTDKKHSTEEDTQKNKQLQEEKWAKNIDQLLIELSKKENLKGTITIDSFRYFTPKAHSLNPDTTLEEIPVTKYLLTLRKFTQEKVTELESLYGFSKEKIKDLQEAVEELSKVSFEFKAEYPGIEELTENNLDELVTSLNELCLSRKRSLEEGGDSLGNNRRIMTSNNVASPKSSESITLNLDISPFHSSCNSFPSIKLSEAEYFIKLKKLIYESNISNPLLPDEELQNNIVKLANALDNEPGLALVKANLIKDGCKSIAAFGTVPEKELKKQLVENGLDEECIKQVILLTNRDKKVRNRPSIPENMILENVTPEETVNSQLEGKGVADAKINSFRNLGEHKEKGKVSSESTRSLEQSETLNITKKEYVSQGDTTLTPQAPYIGLTYAIIERAQMVSDAATAAIGKISAISTNAVNSHITDVTFNNTLLKGSFGQVHSNYRGASAGNLFNESINFWMRSFIGQGKQKATRNLNGFKTNHAGGIIGIESMINDCNLLGLAYSHAALNTKLTGNYIKNKMHATVLTGYLVSFFEEHLYLNSQVKYGWVRLKNSGESKAHNKGTLFGIREELVYEIKLENGFAVAPLIGLAYDKIRLGKFRDQGSRDDVEVSSKRNHSLNGLIGVNIAKAIVKGGVNLVPSIHARLEHALDSKNKAMRIRALDMTADSALLPQKKISKTTFIVGAGVKLVTSGKLEIGVNYDIIRRGEFRSSNGSVKLRIIF